MRAYIIIAMRNLIQAKRRTLLLTSALALVTMLLIIALGLSSAVSETMIRHATALASGHVNIAGFHKNKPTDVLSFPIDLEKNADIKNFKIDDKIVLGDIYICPSVVEENNYDTIKNFQKKLEFVFLHGLTHLLGFDHKNQKQEKKWQKTTEKILN